MKTLICNLLLIFVTRAHSDDNITLASGENNITLLHGDNNVPLPHGVENVSLAHVDEGRLDSWLKSINITPEMVDRLTSGDKALATATIAEILRIQLNKTGTTLDITPTEARFSQSLPNQCQDQTSCGCRAESRDVKVYAAIKKTSSLTSSNNLFEDSGLFLEALIDAEIGAVGDIRARGSIRDLKDIKRRRKRSPGFRSKFKRTFKKVWKQAVRNPVKKINKELIERPLKKLKCAQLVRKTVGFNLVSTGVVKIGIRLNLGNWSLEQAKGGMLLSFLPTFDIIGQIVSWNLDQVQASKCVERIGGLKLFSYCGHLERRARKKIEENMNKIQNVKLPAVMDKLEKKLKTKLGKTVSVIIPTEFVTAVTQPSITTTVTTTTNTAETPSSDN